MALRVVAALVLVCYGFVLAAYVRMFLKEDSRLNRAARFFVPAALALHVAYLAQLGFFLGHPPCTTPFEKLTSLALLIGLLYSYIEWRTRVRSTGALIFFFVFGLQLLSVIFMRPAPDVSGSALQNAHFTLALIGYTAFSISFLYSVMYLMLHDEIKTGNFGLIYAKLPSLEQLDTMNYRAAAAGMLVLCVAIVVGFVSAWTAVGEIKFWSPNVYWSIGLPIGNSLIYGVIIFTKRRFGWDGERIALLSVAGFFIVLISLLANVYSPMFRHFSP